MTNDTLLLSAPKMQATMAANNKNAVNGVSLATCPRTATEATQATRQEDYATCPPAGQLPSRIINLLLEFGRKHRELMEAAR